MVISSCYFKVSDTFLVGLAGEYHAIQQVGIYLDSREGSLNLSDFLEWIKQRRLKVYIESLAIASPFKRRLKVERDVNNFIEKSKKANLYLSADEFWEIYCIEKEHKIEMSQVFKCSPDDIVTIYEQEPKELLELERSFGL